MFNRISIIVLGALFALGLAGPIAVHAATSPTLTDAAGFSVLGGQEVTCTGGATITGDVGVSSGTSITGFPGSCTVSPGTQQSNTQPAIDAQAENLSAFSALNQDCDQTFGAVDLTTTFPSGVGPGVYCSTSSFSLSGNLNLTGSGVWIFKTVSTLITSSDSSVTGGDACNVWWRVGSSVTLGSGTSFIGNILALNGVNAMNAGASLNGRLLVQTAGTVTLIGNTITAPTCSATSAVASESATIQVTKEASKKNLTSGPDKVTFTYRVTNPGNVALSDISVKDDKCDSVDYVSGDDNSNDLLDTDENWKYTCKKTVRKTETNTVTAKGTANGEEVKDTDTAKVTVSTPGLPNTGVGPAGESSISWNSIVPTSVFAILFSFYLARKKLAM